MPRAYFPGIGQAVADRTVNRKGEGWGDVAARVAHGNSLLHPTGAQDEAPLRHAISKAMLLMSGRHLQHGDAQQPQRNLEVFTNCLRGDTKVLTIEYGAVEISLIAGKEVTVIAADGQPRKATINDHGLQETFEITFRDAGSGGGGKFRHTVYATKDHRWFLRDGSVTSGLAVGDILQAAPIGVSEDPQSVVHGVIFGDGSAHKRRRDHTRPGVSQGRTYASIRVCKEDAVRNEIHDVLDAAGHSFSTPNHAAGDRVYYLGTQAHVKDLPFTNDPEYIKGFIRGWWLADGSKGIGHCLEISTSDELAAGWLVDHAGLAGYSVTMHRITERREDDGSYPNGKPLHVVRIREGVEWKVESINPAGAEVVYCPEEPVTQGFVLANGLLTGNCSTAAQRTFLFYLLLNGSGVGTSYDDDMQVVDWSRMPTVVPVIDSDHADAKDGEFLTLTEAHTESVYLGLTDTIFVVPDSREGWAEAVQVVENMTFRGNMAGTRVLIDFSLVRPKGSPIGGMQDRPSSGPIPLMQALHRMNELKQHRWPLWLQAMWIDHILAEIVLVGGARRAARIAVKWWEDTDILEFIAVKQTAGLWSANNSIGVDARFWSLVQFVRKHGYCPTGAHKKARDVFDACVDAQYNHGTGEPGFLNMDLISRGEDHEPDQGLSGSLKVTSDTLELRDILSRRSAKKKYRVIVNPCGEIRLSLNGAYCVIADIAAVFCDDLAEVARLTTRALIRTNLMPSLYDGAVSDTNRIGVGLTAIHEYAWERFGLTFWDLIAEGEGTVIDANGLEMPAPKYPAFWAEILRAAQAVDDECITYSALLGVKLPRTRRTIKPSGSVSKLFGLTEGAHLSSMDQYLRWVQFTAVDPLVDSYEAQGYPIRRDLKSYPGMVIVGFPTKLLIADMMGPNLTTASEASPVDQIRWLRLLETYWLLADGGNQVSYTLKYDPKVVSQAEYEDFILSHVPTVRAVAVMPQIDTTAYEYQPEERVSPERFAEIEALIRRTSGEDVGLEHVDCASGACPVSFDKRDLTSVREGGVLA